MMQFGYYSNIQRWWQISSALAFGSLSRPSVPFRPDGTVVLMSCSCLTGLPALPPMRGRLGECLIEMYELD